MELCNEKSVYLHKTKRYIIDKTDIPNCHVVVIIRWLDLQLPMQSVPITTNVVIRISLMRGVLDAALCDTICKWLAAGRWFSPGAPVSTTKKADRHDIAELLL